MRGIGVKKRGLRRWGLRRWGLTRWRLEIKKGIYELHVDGYVFMHQYVYAEINAYVPRSPTAVINVEILLGATHV
jgi:hypothetical protein